MPDDIGTTEPEEEPAPFFPPEDKHDAGSRIVQGGRISRKIPAIEARYDRRIAHHQGLAEKLTQEKAAALKAANEDAGRPSNELMDFVKRYWLKLTHGGTVKFIKFYSGKVAFRNMQDRFFVTDEQAFFAHVRRLRLAKKLISRGKDRPNLRVLNRYPELAAKLNGVSVERKSTVTIYPKHGWGIIRAIIPRKMEDTTKIEELIGDEPLEWKILPPEDEEE